MGSKVALQMFVLVQARVAVGRQHLAVRVDVDAFVLALLEQCLQVVEVVATHQDGMAAHLRTGADLDGSRSSELGVVGCIEELHDLQVQTAQSQALAQGGVQVPSFARLLVSGPREGRAEAEKLLIDLLALLLAVSAGAVCGQGLGVVEVGHEALQAIGPHLDNAEEILVADVVASGHKTRLGGGQKHVFARLGQGLWQAARGGRGIVQFGGHFFYQGRGSLQVGLEPAVVEVDVREGGEGRLQHQFAALLD
mmetsp:Transcript_44689/g.96077  ORF Transcript_44689/g.96077 Transcript_44689/m.96077 type:complete len:252 (+) Transcript_44689:829-1584(+)